MENKQVNDKKEMSVKELLGKQKKVRIRIPVDKLNKKDTFVPVSVNGYIFQIQRGIAVEVPETVANILENAGYC